MGNDRGRPNNVRRELRMAPQQPSVFSTSQNSGRPLVPGPKVNSRDRSTHTRSGPPSSFTIEQQSNSKPSSRKTKLIIALGLTLPVLACIIGIVAWAMTTDIVRISPHPVRTNFAGIGPKDKSKRKDSFQPRSDHDLDILLLANKGDASLPRNRTTFSTTTTGRSASTPIKESGIPSNSSRTIPPATATEILTKLISTTANKKSPTQFVVFAPIPDNSKMSSKSPEDKKNDRTINIGDETDLVAEESSHSDEISRDFPTIENLRLERRRPPHHHHGEPSRFDEMRDSRAGPPDPREPFPRRSLDNRLHPNRNIQQPDMQFNGPDPPKNFHSNINHPVNDDFPQRRTPSRQHNQPQTQHQYPSPMLQNQQYQQFPNQHKYPQQPVGDPNEDPFSRRYPQSPIHDPTFSGPNTNNNPVMNNNNFGDANKYDVMYSGSQNIPLGSPYSEPGGQQPPGSAYESNGPPQYYAPPPQTFHTSTSYGNTPNSKSGSSMAAYESIGTAVVNKGQAGTAHHHHHHHHHRESNDGGDTHFESSSPTSDADRLGTLGIGFGTPRGITLQVGGLGGLLPIGALGIVRGLASSLLPRPQLGLNRKVFFGVEVGRGGGMSVGLG